MQKLVYLSNSRDYAEQNNVNDNKYFTHINDLLSKGWKVCNMTHDVITTELIQNGMRNETYFSFVLLEKSDEDDK